MVGCDVPVQDEMPTETSLHAAAQRGFDADALPNLGFDGRMLDSVVWVDRVDVQLVGRVR